MTSAKGQRKPAANGMVCIVISNWRKKLAEQRGAVALEALLSIILLLMLTSVTWGLSILIFNFSIISTSAQLATQAGMLTYDRAIYRGVGVDNTLAQNQAAETAVKVFGENSCGTVRGQFSEERPTSGCRTGYSQEAQNSYQIEFKCSARNTEPDAGPDDWGSCTNASRENTEMLRVAGESNVAIPFSYLLDSNQPREEGQLTAKVRAWAYSFVNTGPGVSGP
jgi:hypothetical protein